MKGKLSKNKKSKGSVPFSLEGVCGKTPCISEWICEFDYGIDLASLGAPNS